MDVNLNSLMKSSPETEMEIMTLLTMRPNEFKNQDILGGCPIQSPFDTPLSLPCFQEQHKTGGNSMEAMREVIFRMAMMQPVHIDPESVKPPKRKNVKISKDPQSVAARHRRERISERIRILQRLVPGGTKMDTASMLDEAVHYVKFLKKQLQYLEQQASTSSSPMMSSPAFTMPLDMNMMNMNLNMNMNVNYSG